MKPLSTYLQESIRPLRNQSGIIVFDIDDTLLRANGDDFRIYKKVGNKEVALTTDEFAKDPDAEDPELRELFDYRDFGTPEKVYRSIITGTPSCATSRYWMPTSMPATSSAS